MVTVKPFTDANVGEWIAETIHFLWLSAEAGRLAERLENERKDFFEQLYHFSYGVACLDEFSQRTSTRTEDIALTIIHEKTMYDKRISRLRSRYSDFKRLIDEMIKPDRELLESYFEHGQKVDNEFLFGCLLRNLQIIEGFYERLEMEKDKKAVERLRKYLKHV